MKLPIITADLEKIRHVIESRAKQDHPQMGNAVVLDDESLEAQATIALARSINKEIKIKKVKKGWEQELLTSNDLMIIPKSQDDPFFEALHFQANVEKKNTKNIVCLFETVNELNSYIKTLQKK